MSGASAGLRAALGLALLGGACGPGRPAPAAAPQPSPAPPAGSPRGRAEASAGSAAAADADRGTPTPSPGATAHLIVLHTNDWHGHVRGQGQGRGARGGLAAAAAYVASVRAEAARAGAGMLLLDAGDWFQGTPEGAVEGGGLVVDLLGALGFDAACPGNHDFDLGAAAGFALLVRARFPVTCVNLRGTPPRGPPAPPRASVVCERVGVRVVVVGGMAERLTGLLPPDVAADLVTAPLAPAARAALAEARRDGPAVGICLTHQGVEADRLLAAALPEVDLIVGGHSHSALPRGERPVPGGPLVVQTAGLGLEIGRVDCRVDRASGRVVEATARLVPLRHADVGTDATTTAALEAAAGALDRDMATRVATTTAAFPRDPERFAGVSSPLGNLVADVIREATGAEVACINRAGLRGALPRGPVTRRDVFEVAPFEDRLVVCRVRGRTLRRVLADHLGDPRRPLEVSGCTVVYAREADGDARVRRLEVGGAAVEDDRLYRVGTTAFLAAGVLARAGAEAAGGEAGPKLRDALEAWLRAHDPVAPDGKTRLVLVR